MSRLRKSWLPLITQPAWAGGAAATPWYLSGGIPSANCLAAFQPKGAATYAASKVNLAATGAANNAADGTAFPGWDASYGWGFTAASSQYLTVSAGALVTAVPLTIAVLFQSNNITTAYGLAGITRNTTSVDGWQVVIRGNQPGDPLGAGSIQGGATVWANSSTGYTATTWYTAIAVFSANNARAAYLNGASKGTGSDVNTPSSSVNVTAIGAVHNSTAFVSFLDGKMGAWAAYNTAANDAQAAALSTAMLALVA